MTKTIEQTVNMLEMSPTQEQNLVMELVKLLVLAWDPDFTRLTPDELIPRSLPYNQKPLLHGTGATFTMPL